MTSEEIFTGNFLLGGNVLETDSDATSCVVQLNIRESRYEDYVYT